MAGAGDSAQYRLDCPRCAGPMTALDGAAAVACPHCGETYFLGADGDVGWLVRPHLYPEEGVGPAKRWLREQGRRVTRIGEARGVLVPLYWIRGLLFLWERRPATTWNPPDSGDPLFTASVTSWRGIPGSGAASGAASSPRADAGNGWETHGAVRAYAGAIPGHPLGRLWRSTSVRFAVQPLELLDPDRLPAGFDLLAPTLLPAEAEEEAARWVARRRRAARLGPGRRRAAGVLRRRLNLVAAPLVLVPFAFHDDEGAVVVDGLSGRVRGVVEGPEAPAGPAAAPAVYARLGGPTLLPLECPECGWELLLRERDRLHPCPGCGRCWELVGSRRRAVTQWFRDDRPGPGGRWLPFWVFPRGGERDGPAGDAETASVRHSGRANRHGAGAADRPEPRNANGFPERPLFVPAYSGRHPEDQMLLAAQLTLEPPRGPWVEELEEVPDGAEVGSGEASGWRFAVEGALARRSPAQFARFLAAHRRSDDAPQRSAAGPGAPGSGPEGPASTGADPAGHGSPANGGDMPVGLVWLAFRREGGDFVETSTGARVRAVGTVPWEERRAA